MRPLVLIGIWLSIESGMVQMHQAALAMCVFAGAFVSWYVTVTPLSSCSMRVTLESNWIRAPTSLANARPIASMPPTGWNIVDWNSYRAKFCRYRQSRDRRISDRLTGSLTLGTAFRPPPGAREKPRHVAE